MEQQSELCLFVAGCPPSVLNSRCPTSDKNIRKDPGCSDVCKKMNVHAGGRRESALGQPMGKCVDATHFKADDYSSNRVSFGLKCTNR